MDRRKTGRPNPKGEDVSKQTMSDSLPVVVDTLEKLIEDHGILSVANGLRRIGWEGRELDDLVIAENMKELPQIELFPSRNELHEYNGGLHTEEEIRQEEARDEIIRD